MPSKKLEGSRIYRGGVTARQLGLETNDVELCAVKIRGAVRLSFHISSKGGGTTAVFAEVGSKDFAALIEAMVEADRQETMATMSAELAKQIELQPARDKIMAASARRAVADLAHQKWLDADVGNDEVENFVHNSVNKLIAELENGAEGPDSSTN